MLGLGLNLSGIGGAGVRVCGWGLAFLRVTRFMACARSHGGEWGSADEGSVRPEIVI